ncbi:MAG: hypothetical protein ACRCUT_13820 [Spirochaetota bacterium]
MEKILISREELKKLERKAKALMLAKEIPQGKVDIVRSIMSNAKLLEEERYKAIIELLQNLPNKKNEQMKSPQKVSFTSRDSVKNTSVPVTSVFGPDSGSQHINDLYLKYKSTGLFRKRYLINASNRFGIGFKKRLIPSKKLFKAAHDILRFQEKIISRFPLIIEMILDDPQIEEPSVFNYLRLIHGWLMNAPFSGIDFEKAKWMDQRHFEPEIKPFLIRYFSFREIDAGMRESIILAVENKLREMEDLKKEQIHQIDPGQIRAEKEKRNLECEKIIYDFMMTLRSFLPSLDPAEGVLSQHLNSRYGIASLEKYLVIISEALVFKRDIRGQELVSYYSVRAPRVSAIDWDYSSEYLKKIGKDPESKKKKYYEKMRSIFAEVDERYQYVNMRYDTMDFVQHAFEEQWKAVNKRRQEPGDIYERDFFSFVDETLDYFLRGYLSFISGDIIAFETRDGSRIESSVFSKGYFESEISSLLNLQADLLAIKTGNPNITITRSEAKKIVAGQIPSMANIESFVSQVSAAFYSIGKRLQGIIAEHRAWRAANSSASGSVFREPLNKEDITLDRDDYPRAVPFFNCRLAAMDIMHPGYKNHVGRYIISDAVKDGVLNSLTAFCYQFAYECFDRNLLSDIEYRKTLQKKIENPEIL